MKYVTEVIRILFIIIVLYLAFLGVYYIRKTAQTTKNIENHTSILLRLYETQI